MRAAHRHAKLKTRLFHLDAGYNPLRWNQITELESGMSDIADLRTFVRVVEQGGFAAASKDLGITPSAVSKLVTRLEDRLGVRLLHRTTRRISLTAEGETYHLRARDILAAIEDAEAEVSHTGRRPRGRLRVNCVPAFAVNQLAPVLSEFLSAHPEIELDLALTDRVIDLLAENADVAIRVGRVDDPSLVARKIGEVARGLFASPDYLARHGAPLRPEDLYDHSCIIVKTLPSALRWHFRESGRDRFIDVKSRILVDSGEAALRFAMAGCGITRLADLMASHAVCEGRLKSVLVKEYVVEPVPLSAVYPQGRHRMPKVRVFLDFLVERFGHAPWRVSDV
jgi:DNA-binding transcriptional LysR family regulator